MRYYGYLRASTKDQNAKRAKRQLTTFSKHHQFKISSWFIENESGSKLNRPELFRLLEIAEPGDILLVEQVDRISRLNATDWEILKNIITKKGIRIVSLDLPTSHQFVNTTDEFTGRMLNAINTMMLDMLSAIARKDYEDRKRRQKQGIKKAKEEGKYKGRPINYGLHENIKVLLENKKTYSEIQKLLGCGRDTISKVKKQLLEKQEDNKVLKVKLTFLIENNSKWVRQKKKVIQTIEYFIIGDYLENDGNPEDGYILHIPYNNESELNEEIENIANEIHSTSLNRDTYIEYCDFIDINNEERTWSF